MAVPFHKESILKTAKTLFILVSVVLIGIGLGGCDEAQQMVPPTVEGSGGDTTTTPPVEPPTPEEPPEDSGEETVPPVTEDGGDADTTTDGGGGDTTTTPPVEPPPVVPEGPVVSIMPASVTSPAVGEQLTVEIQIAGAENVSGYEFTLVFDAAALRYVSSENGDYLPGAFFAPPTPKNGNQVKLAAVAGAASPAGSGMLASVTFEVVSRKASTLTLADVNLTDVDGVASEPQVVNAEISE